jgi:hypothetical protein
MSPVSLNFESKAALLKKLARLWLKRTVAIKPTKPRICNGPLRFTKDADMANKDKLGKAYKQGFTANAATLDQQLQVLDENMDAMVQALADQGAPEVVIVYAERVTRAAFEVMLRAHHRKTPIPDIDEAIVATISSILFDYLQRVHPKGNRQEALDHLGLIGQDVTERITTQIMGAFTNGPKIVVPPTRH